MKTRTMAMAATLVALAWSTAQAGTVQNLERERALVVEAILDPGLEAAERQARMAEATPRLVDLERMVLRDDKLKGRNTRDVRRAFANYDLTFLVHASTENNVSAIDAWLGEIGITTQSLMAAKMGRR